MVVIVLYYFVQYDPFKLLFMKSRSYGSCKPINQAPE